MFDLKPYDKKNTVSYYNPFREMEALERELFRNPFGWFGTTSVSDEFRTDITDEGDSYKLEADLPGFDKENIALDVDSDTLTIHAERHSNYENKEGKGQYVRCERSYGSYTRSFDISGIEAEAIKAKYQNGVLSVTLPKKTVLPEESKHITIE